MMDTLRDVAMQKQTTTRVFAEVHIDTLFAQHYQVLD
jgi:hypothetical protein